MLKEIDKLERAELDKLELRLYKSNDVFGARYTAMLDDMPDWICVYGMQGQTPLNYTMHRLFIFSVTCHDQCGGEITGCATSTESKVHVKKFPESTLYL